MLPQNISQRFPGKRAFITGAASGLGLEFAAQLEKQGWRLLIADINPKRLDQAKVKLTQLGAETIAITIDVAKLADIESAANLLIKQWQGVDMVFNNAGVAGAGEIDTLSINEWERVVNIDLWSVVYGCRVFAPIMKAQQSGYIINTASSAGTLAAPQMANYNVAKAGVVSLSETLKVELAPFNIGVTVICPTVFKTNLSDSMVSQSAFEKNLTQQLEESKVTSADVVKETFSKMSVNKLYVMPQTDARWGWRFKRWFPEIYLRLLSHLYIKRKWLFAHLN